MTLPYVELQVEQYEVEELPSCDAITQTLSDGIHDKTCGLVARTAVVGDENEQRLCSIHLRDLVNYVSDAGEVPEWWNAQVNQPWNHVNIKGGAGDCDCEHCN